MGPGTAQTDGRSLSGGTVLGRSQLPLLGGGGLCHLRCAPDGSRPGFQGTGCVRVGLLCGRAPSPRRDTAAVDVWRLVDVADLVHGRLECGVCGSGELLVTLTTYLWPASNDT